MKKLIEKNYILIRKNMETTRSNLTEEQQEFQIMGRQVVVTLGETKFRASFAEGVILLAHRFKNKSTNAVWVIDPEGVYEDGEELVMKFEYVEEIIGEEEPAGEIPAEESSDDDDEFNLNGPGLSDEDDMQKGIQARLQAELAEKKAKEQKNKNQNQPPIPLAGQNGEEGNGKKKRKPRSRNKDKKGGNNQHQKNGKNNHQVNNGSNDAIEKIGSDETFKQLYYGDEVQFGTQVSQEDFAGVLTGKSSIGLAVRLTYSDNVLDVGNMVIQDGMNDKSKYVTAYIGYECPINSGNHVINYHALVLVAQKLSVKYAGQKIVIDTPDFGEEVTKATQLLAKELSTFSEIFVVK